MINKVSLKKDVTEFLNPKRKSNNISKEGSKSVQLLISSSHKCPYGDKCLLVQLDGLHKLKYHTRSKNYDEVVEEMQIRHNLVVQGRCSLKKTNGTRNRSSLLQEIRSLKGKRTNKFYGSLKEPRSIQRVLQQIRSFRNSSLRKHSALLKEIKEFNDDEQLNFQITRIKTNLNRAKCLTGVSRFDSSTLKQRKLIMGISGGYHDRALMFYELEKFNFGTFLFNHYYDNRYLKLVNNKYQHV